MSVKVSLQTLKHPTELIFPHAVIISLQRYMHKGTCTHTLTQTLLLLVTSLASFSDTVKMLNNGIGMSGMSLISAGKPRSTNSIHGWSWRQQFTMSWRGARGYFRQIPLYILFSMLTSFRLLDQNQFGQSHPPGWFSHSLHLFPAWGCSAWWLLAFPCQCPGFQLHCRKKLSVQNGQFIYMGNLSIPPYTHWDKSAIYYLHCKFHANCDTDTN